jgi:hypothetical protein
MDEGIRKKILTVLDQHRVLTIATLRIQANSLSDLVRMALIVELLSSE